MKVVYLDMDGVLVDFSEGVRLLTGKRAEEWDGELNPKKDGERNEMWARIHEAGEPFWHNLPALPEGVALYHILRKMGARVVVMTADGGHAVARRGKLAWLEEQLGHVPSVAFVHDGADKAMFAHRNAVLIDDRKKVTVPFMQNEGQAVLWPGYEEQRDDD